MLLITHEMAQSMVAQAVAGLPEEVCGLLGGPVGKAVDIRAISNIADRPDVHYLMDPNEQWAAFQAYEAAGWELLAVYHSHPAGPAHPSETDIAASCYPGVAYFIVSLEQPDAPSLTAWLIEDGAVRPAAWQVTTD